MRARPKQPTVPADRPETIRQEIISALQEESLTAREISGRVEIAEKEVLEHLEHIRVALHSGLVVIPAQCIACGFLFRKRERLKGPGRCPVCRSEHIAEPSFAIT
jgi:predicted Zn-ribbon and HTH transcriptional regulator